MSGETFLHTFTADKWKQIGVHKRAGVAVPLFSIYSKNSIGIGEIPDLKYLVDWCKLTGMSIIQLLPLNDMGYDNAPYNAASTFALDPVYLSIKYLKSADLSKYHAAMISLEKKFPIGKGRINYKIKGEKLKLLGEIYKGYEAGRSLNFKRFKEKNIDWLRDYALYKVIKEKIDNRSWEEWDDKYKYAGEDKKESIYKKFNQRINFHYWVQWQLYEQFRSVKKYAASKEVLLLGDLPFLVSRDSADVWAKQKYFKLDLVSGAPPDMYFANGQKWGMPPYHWHNIAADGFSYIKQRLQYAENFYNMFRIDHFVGLFRVWTIPLDMPAEHGGLNGRFDPPEEYHWEEHGRTILSHMITATNMLPCAEDLGTVPQCSNKVLEDFGVPGIDVQRWKKIYHDSFPFVSPENYRRNSIATVSTHDSSTLAEWWEKEAATIDKIFFERACSNSNISGQRLEEIKGILFDENKATDGRLYWNDEINSVPELLSVLGIDQDDAGEIIGMYLSSYGEKRKFADLIGYDGTELDNATSDLIRKSLESANSSASIFSIQLIGEWLSLEKDPDENSTAFNSRINFPGTVSGSNWSVTLPYSMEKIKRLKVNSIIKDINLKHGRV